MVAPDFLLTDSIAKIPISLKCKHLGLYLSTFRWTKLHELRSYRNLAILL